MANAIFFKFDGLDGECRESQHEKWIQVESFSHHLAAMIDRSATSGTGGHSVGTAEHGDISFSKVMDSSSMPIYAKCCAGKSFDQVDIELMTSSSGTEATPNQRILKIVLKKVYIASVSYSDGAGSTGRPMENIALNYRFIEWTYTPYGDDGSSLGDITKYWNLETNTGG